MNELLGELSELVEQLAAAVRDMMALSGFGAVDMSMALALAVAAGLGLLLILLWFLQRPSRAYRASRRDLKSRTRSARLLGYLSAAIFVGGFGVWSAMAMIASAVVAQGVVSPEGYRRTVQHLEGGIINAILVKEGDKVTAGQVLISMKATDAQGRFDELDERYVHLLAIEARLAAELVGATEIIFPEELAAREGKDTEQLKAGEQELLQSRLASREGRERILQQRRRQIEEEITGLNEVMVAQNEQLALIDREIQSAQALYKKGLERLPRVLAMQRAQADIRANQAANRAQVARNQQQIGETEMQLLNLRQQDREAVNEELTKIRGGLAEVRSQLPWRQDVLARTTVVAPISGTVINLRVTTESGVIASGQPILDIVPSEPNMIIDSRIKPSDIDMLHPDMLARVVLSAYPQRHLPQIHGLLTSVSADRFTDERTGEPYFLAKVKVDAVELGKLHGVRLSPGMPAEVMILTGEHTLFDYMLAPLRDSLNRGMREN
ncbi:HlyD family type I secretion periplasmic adaptor subunit (plasmid) [Aminobacter sp. SR38]|jgi:HlyD family type I secretion membrane fusion protein|uniref:HlyD family type I secretion periplasmic adaptor subunit n=1 Tax=Aminobacter sp. SR38 TaxID=2774562 RepID=UPI00177D5A15|nr:HlyD family type I secretion periplasmic adaptor subunit [Aminobacter sp. SR38]QOF74509.1 HlyD family type I secretion periplasmic adaptor subunit [Aminobacter sp. SR38]